MSKQKKLIEEEEYLDDNLESTEEEFDHPSDDPEFSPEEDYAKIQSRISYDDEEYFHKTSLNQKIDEIFSASRWSIISPSKKIPKDLIPLIFQDILKELESTEYTMVEKFVGICDYANINYQKAYESIHMKYKEEIVQEMDRKYGILSKKGIKKIF
jgi:hypothetical protein